MTTMYKSTPIDIDYLTFNNGLLLYSSLCDLAFALRRLSAAIDAGHLDDAKARMDDAAATMKLIDFPLVDSDPLATVVAINKSTHH